VAFSLLSARPARGDVAERRLGQPDQRDHQHEQHRAGEEYVIDGERQRLTRDDAFDDAPGAIAAAESLHVGIGRVARAGEVFGEHRVVVVAAMLPSGDGECGRDARGDRAAEIRKARCGRDLVWLEPGQEHLVQRDEEARNRHAHDEARPQQLIERRVVWEQREPVRRRREHDERERDHCAQFESLDVAADDRRQQEREHADRRGRVSGPARRIAEHGLQPKRIHDVDAEETDHAERHHAHADHEIAFSEQAEIDDRMLVGEFPRDQEREADDRDDEKDRDELRREPVLVVAVVEHELQTADADDEQGQADHVDRRLHDRRFALAQQAPRDDDGENADRRIDVEDPRPRIIVGEITAEDRPEDRRDDDRHRPQREREALLLVRIVVEQQAERQRDHRPRTRALREAGEDEHRHARGDAAQHRHDHEQERRHAEHAHFAELPSEPARQRLHDRAGERVGTDRPRAFLRTHAEAAGDVRHGHVDDRDVEHFHERRERDRDGQQCERRAMQRRQGGARFG
jgi:hypothetical protein